MLNQGHKNSDYEKGKPTCSEIAKEVNEVVDTREIKAKVVSTERLTQKNKNLVNRIKGSAEKARDFCKLLKDLVLTAKALLPTGEE